MNSIEPLALRLQNASVALDPANGRATALSRPSSSTHVTGADHCVFDTGPVGPLLNDGAFSPQCPSYDSQANDPSVGTSSPGSMMSSGSTRSTRALVLSQPKPVAPLLPNQRDDEKNEACEPSAAKTTGRTPSSTSLSSFSPTVAYSEPSCWA